MRKRSDLFINSMNAIVRQVDPADLGGVDESFCCDLRDVVVLKVQIVGPGRDDRDNTDVSILTVERVWIIWGT